MAENIVDSIFVRLGVKTDDVERGLKDMEAMVKRSMTFIARDILAPVLSFTALKNAIANFTDSSIELGKLAKASDMSISRLQAWRGAAEEAGISADGFGNSIYKIQESLSTAAIKGRSDFTDMLNRLSVGWMQAGGEARKAEDVILDVSDRLSKLSNSQAIYAGKSLGFDRDQIQFLRQGRDALAQLLEEQRTYADLTEEDQQAAQKFNASLSRLRRSWEVLANRIARLVLPAIQLVTVGISKFAGFLMKHETFFTVAFIALAGVLTWRMIPALVQLIKLVKQLGLAFLTNPASISIAAMVAGIALLTAALDDLWTYAKGGKSSEIFTPLWEALGTPEEVMEMLQNLGSTLKSTLSTLARLLGVLAGPLGKFLLALMGIVGALKLLDLTITGIRGAFALAVTIFTKAGSVVMALGKALQFLVTVLRAVAVAAAANPVGAIIAAIAAAAVLIILNWDKVKEYFFKFFGWLNDILDATIGGILRGIYAVTDAVKGFWNWLTGNDEVEIGTKFAEPSSLDMGKMEVDSRGDAAPAFDPYGNRPGYAQRQSLGRLDPSQMDPATLQTMTGLGDAVRAEQAAQDHGYASPIAPPASTSLQPSVINNNAGATTIDQQISIDKIDIVTRATDAQGIASGIRTGLEDRLNSAFVVPASRGVNNK